MSQTTSQNPPVQDVETDSTRMHGVTYWAVLTLGAIGLLMAINQTFMLRTFGFQPLGNSFLYYLIGLFLAAAYLIYPMTKAAAHRTPWYDWVFAAVILGCSAYLGSKGLTIIVEGWDNSAPLEATVISGILLVMLIEGVRRCGGTPLLVVVLLFGSYPIYAGYMPGFLWGNEYSLGETIRAHVMGVESIIGIPMQVVANLVIGFVVFGAALTVTGGGEFFMRFATSLMGASRGGPAKVAVVSSGFMGSLSGSVISNILTTGAFTIPTMKRTGYPPQYAGAVEACASTGGTLMPPVMGAVAFIMASFLGVPYADVIVAAFLPALLFYIALLFQVDAYAARVGLKGLEAHEIPKLWQVLKEGWPYLFSLGMLIYMLLFMRLETYAPYYATVVLLVISVFKKSHRFSPKLMLELLKNLSVSVANLVAILAGIGLVVGGLSYSGVAGSFSRELLLHAGGSIPLMLVAGAVTSFILGMGMTVSACYIFLSILLAPALINAGLNPLASHLFILYWGMMSFITPPVSLAAITAANIAGANSWATGLTAMRLGSVLFVLPFMFVVNPLLIMQGDWGPVLLAAATAITAMWVLASALEAYLYRVGVITWPTRLLLFVAGGMLAFPGGLTDITGLILVGVTYVLARLLPFMRAPGASA
jgi:TRAP transporter 4TM/12TM fusion protein